MHNHDFSTIHRIRRLATTFCNDSDHELQRKSLALKYEASIGRSLSRILPQAFALAMESAKRSIGLTPYNVQIFGAIQIANGKVAEMKTGEGKTLTATMPVYLHALTGKGVHVATVNDYLAQRDFELMSPVYHRLGLTTGVVLGNQSPAQRRLAYAKDITYGTAKEFGFDFLRDRLARLNARHGDKLELTQRELNFALVDEADSVLIDEARTPLIIGLIDPAETIAEQACARWAAQHAEKFSEGVHFRYDHPRQKVELLEAGLRQIRVLPQTNETRALPIRRLHKLIENAIKVRRDFELDKNYVVRDEKIAIVDEFTGRVAEGRQWQHGIHQAVEAKEGLEITPATRHGATVTLQSFIKKYRVFAGMTGTAWTSRREFQRVYQSAVVRIPTHRPVRRIQLPTKIFADFHHKMAAVADEAEAMSRLGRAVLIGTRSIEKSEALSRLLRERNIAHEVLNANNLSREAEIVARCGQVLNPTETAEAKPHDGGDLMLGCVTVATNMAGRGTDILLADSVRAAGGLHVILTELHESQRIDWQLIGRGARQGDPGSFRIFVALDDELLRLGLGPQRFGKLQTQTQRLAQSVQGRTEKVLPYRLFRFFQLAQYNLERKHFVDRMILRKQDSEKHERQFEMGLDPYCEVVG